MNEKVLTEIYVPALEISFDVFIPLQIPMYEILELLKRAVTDMSEGRFIANSDTAICYRENGAIMNINLSAFELGLRNGSRLMLI